jgi:pSer/pThr/pTyr-binding forkhead associated (FHA) protein
MAGKVSLVVTAGPIRGRRYDFTDHDTFLFGRAPDCHARLDASDTSASRHHFLLEVNPPLVELRDLGSLNGTNVNGVRHGGRRPEETPEQAKARGLATVGLRHGDEVRVGATIIRVEVETPPSSAPTSGARALAAAAARASLGDPLPTGLVVGRYVLESLLGRGGMGVVYRARRVDGGAPVAVKILLPRVDVDEGAEDLFLREIEVTRALRHPNIVALLEAGRHEGRLYVALEYCARGSAEKLRRDQGGRLSLPTVVRLALESAEGLAAAHEKGFVHRDLKPDNLLLAEDGAARIADFGLAKSFQQTGLSGMTATGAVAGTFHFMPREQLTAYRDVRPVSDVWSLAATLYFLLTGAYARDFESTHDPLAVILRGGTVPLRTRDPSVPADFARVFDKALADAPEQRYGDARALASALRAVL